MRIFTVILHSEKKRCPKVRVGSTIGKGSKTFRFTRHTDPEQSQLRRLMVKGRLPGRHSR